MSLSIGMVLLSAVTVLVYLGVTQRVLDRMRLSDRMAILFAALMFFGGLAPNVRLGLVEINLGGALVPVGICLYLLIKAETGKEAARALLGAVLTAAAVYALGKWLPDEPEAMVIEPNYLYGLAAGLIAYVLGRSRRGAFICGILGVALADTAVALINWRNGIDQPLVLGGAGVFDVMVIAALVGVLLAELVGEIRERAARKKEGGKA